VLCGGPAIVIAAAGRLAAGAVLCGGPATVVAGAVGLAAGAVLCGGPAVTRPELLLTSAVPHTGQVSEAQETAMGWITAVPQLGHTHNCGRLLLPAVALPIGGIVSGCPS